MLGGRSVHRLWSLPPACRLHAEGTRRPYPRKPPPPTACASVTRHACAGRPWGADHCAEEPWPLQVGVGLCAHLQPDQCALGPKGVCRLPRCEPTAPACACARARPGGRGARRPALPLRLFCPGASCMPPTRACAPTCNHAHLQPPAAGEGDKEAWKQHDAAELMAAYTGPK